MKNSNFTSQFILSLFIIFAVIALSSCAVGKKPKPKPECLMEKCTGLVTLADLDYSTATCTANKQQCEYKMPDTYKFLKHKVEATACSKKGRCGKGDTCAEALKVEIRNKKFDLENKRTVLLAGANNACVTSPSPNKFPCVWTNPTNLPDAEFKADKPPAVCTKKKCFCKK